jgi:hypothetical protein
MLRYFRYNVDGGYLLTVTYHTCVIFMSVDYTDSNVKSRRRLHSKKCHCARIMLVVYLLREYDVCCTFVICRSNILSGIEVKTTYVLLYVSGLVLLPCIL